MGLDPFLPNHVLRLMSKDDRKALGKAGVTSEEAADKAQARSEKELQDQIEQFLRMRGVKWIVRSRMDRKTTNQKGNPDFLFVYHGTPMAWEAKLPGESLRVEQHQAAVNMLQDGWHWRVITDLSEAKETLDDLNPAAL